VCEAEAVPWAILFQPSGFTFCRGTVGVVENAVVSRAGAQNAAFWIPVQGNSMWPRLRPGDEAELIDADASSIETGDVVVARISSALVIHRLLSVRGDHLLLRGDNSAAADPPIPREHLLGVVGRVRRRGAILDRVSWDRAPGLFSLIALRLRRRARTVWTRLQ
jgi:hypothetical protein